MKYFVSYTQKDRAWAEWIAWQIEASKDAEGAQNEVMIQAWDFGPGSNFMQKMNEASEWADVTVPVLSAEYMESKFGQAEWLKALSKDPTSEQGHLIPIRISECEIKGLLGPVVYLDLVGIEKETAQRRLAAGLRGARLKPDTEPEFPPDLENSARAPKEEPAFPGQADLLTRYLDLVRQDHGRLLHLLGKDEDSELLEKVYVSLALQPDSCGPPSRKLEGQALGPMSLRQLLELDPAQHPWLTRRWVVRGDPGSGKTTLLRHLASTLAGEALASKKEPAWIPMFFSLPRLVRGGGSPLDLIEEKLRRADMDEGARERFEELGRTGRLLVLLDGLDEVPDDGREAVEDLLLGMQNWRGPIVVSTRPIGYTRPDAAFREVDVQPLTREQQVEFLSRRLRCEDGEPDTVRAEQELRILEGHPSLDELARNPLYLTLMSFLIRDGAALTGNRSQLYQEIFDLLLSGRHRKRSPSEPIEPIARQPLVRQALQHLAYQMSHQNRDCARQDELEELLEQDEALCRKLGKHRRWQDDLWQFLDDVAALTSILAPHDGDDEDWRYWHRTFREALAAEQLETLWRENEAKVLEHAKTISAAKREEQDKSRWAEAYAILAGRLAQPDALVMALLEQDQELGLRAFEGVRVLAEDTLHQLFANQDWEIRTAAYERLPDLIATPDRALELIDELRQKTRKGNDLFFLDLAARRAGERWPQAEPGAASLRARLYDHIPEPPAELFRWVDTPHDGRVELWREIPAGEGWVGAAEGEKEAFERERPRHRVEILRPFAMAVVPVTQKQYAAFDPEHTSFTEGFSHPVDGVTWYEAVSFCRWLATLPGFAGTRPRLPVEEEWEYACRAGSETRYWSGDTEEDLKRVGWYGKPGGSTHCVGEKPVNPWGLYDVHGNVWEWTASPWDAKRYQGRSADEPFAVDPGVSPADLAAPPRAGRVLRGGGCWDSAQWCRSAYRSIGVPWSEVWDRGFRVLLSSVPSRP